MPPTTAQDSIEDRVRTYIATSVALAEPPQDDDKLVDKGFIPSVRLLDLIGFLEDTFKVKLRAVDLVPEKLSTIRKIADVVRSRLKG